jgi:26S proteasome regulatory subunit N8
MSTKTVENVVVHPLVLLSAVDHYNRVARNTRRRVVGVLLGESYQGRGACVRPHPTPRHLTPP